MDSTEVADTLIGRTIAGKFTVMGFLGEGAMGRVYKARQNALDKVVALKIMHQELAANPTFAARFQREAQAASRLDHPNSVRVIDFGQESDGMLYLAMEFLDGPDLFETIREHWPLPVERTANILMQALSALATAHELGIIHRDLKPENIVLLRGKDDEGNPVDVVKVCDFGIAKIAEAAANEQERRSTGPRLTSQGQVVGTPEYMSPEQGRGEPLDARSDLYSVGVILFQILTGQLPFDSETALGIVLKHVTEPPPVPSTLNPQADARLEEVCLRALRKNREERYQSAREMRTALKTVAGQSGRVSLANSASSKAPESGPRASASPRPPAPPLPRRVRASSKITPLGTVTSATRHDDRRPRRMWMAVGSAVVALVLAVALTARPSRNKGGNSPTVTSSETGTPKPEVIPTPQAAVEAPTATPAAVAVQPAASSEPKRHADAQKGKHPRGKEDGLPPLVFPEPTAASSPPAAPSAPPAANGEPPVPAAPAQPAAPPAIPEPAPTGANTNGASPTGTSVARVTVGDIRAERINPTAVRAAMTALMGKFTKCYQEETRKKGESVEGPATLSMEVDGTGRVTDATLTGASAAALGGNCIVRNAMSSKIKDVESNGGTATVSLRFSSGQ